MFLKKSSSKSAVKNAVKNIVTINAYKNRAYSVKNDLFQPLSKLSYNTSNFITSYISNKDIISTTVHLSRSIPKEDISDILDIKAYEELQLDQATSYIIGAQEVQDSGEDREFHLFVAEPEVLDRLYLPIKEKTKYLDLIIPAPLLYKALYTKEILKESGTHCFIYFTRKDAFVTFYNEGVYLYSKTIEFSLEQIYEKYCEMVGERVDEKEFFTILESEGLKSPHSTYQQNFMKIFGEVFIAIHDIILYAKRAFELEAIDQMFIGSVNGPIIGLDDYSQNYLGIHSLDLNFNYNIESNENYIDQFQYLMLLSSYEYMDDENSTVNLTKFLRPPPFFKRASGQFIIATSVAVFLGLAYPLYYFVDSYMNEAKISNLTIENNRLTTEANKYKKILGQKKKEISSLDEQIEKLSKQYEAKIKTLTAIYNKKVHYRLKSGMFHVIAEELDKFEVNVDKMYSKGNTLWLSIISSDDRKFTEMIKYISDSHFDEIEEINIDLIKKDENSSDYRGLLKVDLR